MAARAVRQGICQSLSASKAQVFLYPKRRLWVTSTMAVSHVYHITVNTGDVFGAGTDANVFVRMIGEKGSTDEIKLKTEKGDMERGMTNMYKIFAEDVGRLDKLIIRHDNTGLGPAWYLKQIHIRDRKNQVYNFNCDDWLVKGHEDNTVRLLREENFSEETMTDDNQDTGYYERFENFDPKTVLTSNMVEEETNHMHDKSLETVMRHIANDSQDEVVEVVFDEEIKLQNEHARLEEESHDGPISSHQSVFIHPPSTKHSKLLSPAVRALLDMYGLELLHVPATGRHSRVLKGDVLDYLNKKNITEKKIYSYIPPVYNNPSHLEKHVLGKEAGKIKPPSRIQHTVIPGVETYVDHPTTSEKRQSAYVYTTNKYSKPHIYLSSKCNIENLYSSIKILNTLYSIDCTEVLLARLFAKSLNDCGLLKELNATADINIISSTEDVQLGNCLAGDIEELVNRFENSAQIAENKCRFSLHVPDTENVIHVSSVLKPEEVILASFSGTQLTVDALGRVVKSSSLSLTCDGSVITENQAAECLKTFINLIQTPLAAGL